ncbi:hypothetical protein [Streptomyces sp. enrichment culture]|uniref:hypothetical protein n=1 Tax=Streptomyces sp. enrichment culture TaxID=1795815 RepID=UPI003F57A700
MTISGKPSIAWSVARRTAAAPAVRVMLTCLASVAVALAFVILLESAKTLPHVLPNYSEAQAKAYSDIGGFLYWILGDTTEPQFYKSALGGLGMLVGGGVAHTAWKLRKRWAGFPVSYGTGLWPWVTSSAALGLLISNVAWGWTVPATGGWQPTFVPFVSVPPAVVLVYGRGWTVAVTGAVLGAALTTPISLFVNHFICVPNGLPSVVASVTGMWAGALAAFIICRHLPWMPQPLVARSAVGSGRTGPVWIVRRILADFTEAQFYGNEIASLGLIAGTALTYVLNPFASVYGTGLLPAVLIAQVMTAAIGVVFYRRRWAAVGWYPTFVPVVSVAPAVVLTYGPSVQAVVVGAVLGALVAPPTAAAISRHLPEDFHPFIGNVLSMTICTLAIVISLGFIPGFAAAP